jgi:hypothetical protein
MDGLIFSGQTLQSGVEEAERIRRKGTGLPTSSTKILP